MTHDVCPTTCATEMKKYDISDINQYGVLKLGFPLLLAFIFLTRHWWLAIGVMMSRSAGVMDDFFDGSIKYFLAAEFPVLLLCVMAMNRKPAAGKFIRGVWKQGRWLLLLATLLNLGLLVVSPVRLTIALSRLDGLQWGAIAVNACILAYVLFLPRARDVFAEFPAPQTGNKP